VELQQAQEQYVRIVITEDIMSAVALIVIVRKMVIECYKVESIFLHSIEPMLNYTFAENYNLKPNFLVR
jgi:hypothetical protein